MSASEPARAEQAIVLKPLKPTGTRLIVDATPAEWEWAYWTSGGASKVDSESWSPNGGIGAELTFGVLTYPGFPSGPYRRSLARGELRIGPWVAASTRSDGGLVEGGLTLDWGAVYHASFGTFDLRLGAGHGAFAESRTSHGVLTLTYGVRNALHRYSKRASDDPAPTPKVIAMASVARLFVTYRQLLSERAGSELTFGVELSPTYLLPPYGWFRLLGGPSRPLPRAGTKR